MENRVNLNFIGNGNAAKSYGGKLEAWSFYNIQGEAWFLNFKNHVLSCVGKKYLPIYRMADGEYRFLMGRKYNFYSKQFLKEFLIVTAEKLKIKNPNKWKTSWGEEYTPKETFILRENLLNKIKEIANDGYLACYINDNGLNAFTEHNNYILPFFKKNHINFNSENYIPFHFVVHLLLNDSRHDFYVDKNILLISGTEKKTENQISNNLKGLGVKNIQFIRISKTSSMKDIIDLSSITNKIDLCLVAAGIGSANIISQLKPLNTVVLDIGGYINCLNDTSKSQHGGIFTFPNK